jgi:Bacterial Ig domain
MKIFTKKLRLRSSLCGVMGTMLLALAAAAVPGHAVNYVWVGTDDDESHRWHTATNWSPVGVPGAADSASIGANKTVELTQSVSVAGFAMGAGSLLDGNGSLTINSVGALTDVRIGSPGSLIVAQGATLTISSVGTPQGTITGIPGVTGNINTRFDGPFYNFGTVNWNSGNLLAYSKFEIRPGSVFRAQGNGVLVQDPIAPSLLSNRGTVTKNSTGQTTIALPVSNTGTWEVPKGTLRLLESFTQTSGTTKLSGGTISSTKTLSYRGGRLAGSGTIAATVNNSGAVFAPGNSPGAVVINGNYVQASNGTLEMEIGGTVAGTGFDQLQINGTATLAGTLNLIQYNGFTPAAGDSFQLMLYDLAVGDFSTVTNTFVNAGTYFSTVKLVDSLVVQTTADAALPTVSFTTPASGAIVTSLPSVSGIAADSPSGLTKVQLRIKRVSDNLYWNGSIWRAGSVYMITTLTNGVWTRTSSLPAGANLAPGSYQLTALATDKANNQRSSTITITVQAAAPLRSQKAGGAEDAPSE